MAHRRWCVKDGRKPLATVVFQHPVYPVHKMSIPYHGIPAKNTALQMIFRIAGALQARACCILDTRCESLTSRWLLRLLQPVLEEGYDFVAPIYIRRKFDGMLTRLIVYPTVPALFGRPLRQPLAGEFCLSGSLV